MRKGFIINHNKCVNCSACSAACLLENGWDIHMRTIYSHNFEAHPSLAVTHLSLACNHCEIPVCLEGCPTSSYRKDPLSGAIIINERKCIGCKYCQWNCPFDAPKFSIESKVIGKCNLCNTLLKEGSLPACVNACSTGALMYGELPESIEKYKPVWFPDKYLKPSIIFTGSQINTPLQIIPERKIDTEIPVKEEKGNPVKKEWSLTLFSFLTTISVATVTSSLINGIYPNELLFLTLIILAGFSSFFHLGKWYRALRALSNLKSSPLSREVLMFIVYSFVSVFMLIFQSPASLIASALTGLILLITIDTVYIYSDKRKYVVLHSGQTFISALLIISFFSGLIAPFIFIATIKIASTVFSIHINKLESIDFNIRFIRLALLFLTGTSLFFGISSTDIIIISLFLAGELLDRIVFYADFSPVNIKNEIINHLNMEINEKKRG